MNQISNEKDKLEKFWILYQAKDTRKEVRKLRKITWTGHINRLAISRIDNVIRRRARRKYAHAKDEKTIHLWKMEEYAALHLCSKRERRIGRRKRSM